MREIFDRPTVPVSRVDWRLGAVEALSAALSTGFFVYRFENDELRLCHANAAGLTICDLGAGDHTGKKLTELFPEAQEFEDQLMELVRPGGRRSWEDYGYEDEERTTNPRIEAFALGASHVGVVFDDLKPIRDANDRLRASVQQLDARNRELASFTRVASHDLQEPLRKITTFGERLKTRAGDQLDDRSRDYLDRMVAASTRLSKLIEHLREYTRLAATEVIFEPVDLQQVVRDVMDDLDLLVELSGVLVEVTSLPKVAGDPMLLHRLMQNLIHNAIKYRREDGPQPWVRVEAERFVREGCGWVRISVRDNGIGFEEEHEERIFGLFQRLHARSEYEGTGLGLAIAKRAVTAHGGSIRAMGSPGEGATFVVELPTEGRHG